MSVLVFHQIKVINLAPLSVCYFRLPPFRVLSCISVFLVAAMHAQVYYVRCGSEDVTQCVI